MYNCTRPLRSALNTIERPSGANAIAVRLGRPCPIDASRTNPLSRRSAGATPMSTRLIERSGGGVRFSAQAMRTPVVGRIAMMAIAKDRRELDRTRDVIDDAAGVDVGSVCASSI